MVERIIWAVLPSILCGVVMYYFQRHQRARDAILDAHAEARKDEARLQMEMQFATGQLSYACAMALKRGKPNGEVEEGVKSFHEAEEKYKKFLRGQAVEHIS